MREGRHADLRMAYGLSALQVRLAGRRQLEVLEWCNTDMFTDGILFVVGLAWVLTLIIVVLQATKGDEISIIPLS